MAKEIKVDQYKMTPLTQKFVWVFIFIGIITMGLGLKMDAERIWHSYLTSFFFFTSLALSGLFFIAISNMTNAGWSVTFRRIPEAFTAFLPYAAIAMIGVFIGGDFLFSWLDPQIAATDHLIHKKISYLNRNFWIIRSIIFFAIWLFFSWKIVGNSLAQDKDGDASRTRKNVPLSVAFIVFFALTYSFFSVDQLMSLDPHWFSTIFGVYAFAGLFQSGCAMMILFMIRMIQRGYLKSYVDENHVHDVAKYMFAFTVFWAYIAFSQYLLIWYANLPEETIFFIERMHGGWVWVSIFLILFKFIIPFLALAPRWAKRNFSYLPKICYLVLFTQYVDMYWLIYPNYNHDSPVLSGWEIGVFLGFLGLFLMAVNKFLAKHPVVPLKDPRAHEALHHHI